MSDQPTESPDLDPEFTPIENVERDKRGSPMSELESWERVIEGLKLASDGARHMTRHRDRDTWNRLAIYFDSLRKAVIKDGGFDRPSDAALSTEKWGGTGISYSDALGRVMTGLRGASAGAKQISLGQRMDLRWTQYAEQFERLRDKCREIAIQQSPLRTDAGWRTSGLVVPARMH